MSHDFAKRKKANSKRSVAGKSQLPAWFWMFTGVVAGLFIAFLVYLSTLQFEQTKSPERVEETNERSQQIKKQAERMREGKEVLKKPTFEFYQRLPEAKIETPRPPARTETGTTPKKTYILQAGSFRSYQDADALKASLIMQGLDVNISSVTDTKGNAWHRVQVGPFTSEQKINRAMDVLAENNIASIKMEVK